ncbi:NLP/P60 family protein [Pseudomonas synxantha]|uniref:NLP/P60 family protein n=1 Tax=Pseudomonas synxantha TaxID=47883 RepID=A0A3G7UE65_9PSED|nr:C40 family peptidase [Pseudomonas synxantha]AZE56836.1 NLP/P60 family protein [Pseudomonas synxantha]
MLKVKVVVALCCLFSGPVLASQKQEHSINTAYLSLLDSRSAGGSSRHASKVVGRAHELIGAPYRWGGASVSQGFDCSGLLVYLFRSEAGIHIPRTTALMLSSASKFVEREHLKSGDVVFFKHNGRQRMKHAGIYIGNNKFIHAPRAGKHVRIDSLSNKYWNKSYFSARRFH